MRSFRQCNELRHVCRYLFIGTFFWLYLYGRVTAWVLLLITYKKECLIWCIFIKRFFHLRVCALKFFRQHTQKNSAHIFVNGILIVIESGSGGRWVVCTDYRFLNWLILIQITPETLPSSYARGFFLNFTYGWFPKCCNLSSPRIIFSQRKPMSKPKRFLSLQGVNLSPWWVKEKVCLTRASTWYCPAHRAHSWSRFGYSFAL